MLDVIIQCVELVEGHPAMNATIGGVRFVLGEVVAGLGPNEDKDLLKYVMLWGLKNDGVATESMRNIGGKLSEHLSWRQYKIDSDGSDGAAWHAIVLRGFRILHYDQTTLIFDG